MPDNEAVKQQVISALDEASIEVGGDTTVLKAMQEWLTTRMGKNYRIIDVELGDKPHASL